MKSWVLVALTASVLLLAASHLFADSGVDKTLLSRPQARETRDEADAPDEQSCFSMGTIDIAFASGEVGLPKVGLRIMDPRGRKIGYDPRTSRGWLEVPLAQASLDCQENQDTGELRHCKGHLEICGPIGGTYQLEVLPTDSGIYSIIVSTTSPVWQNQAEHGTTSSRAELKAKIHGQEPEVLLLDYSREAGTHIRLIVKDRRLTEGTERYSRGSSH